MKTLIFALLVSGVASAYNTSYEAAAYGKTTVVTSKRSNLNPQVVSFKLETRSVKATQPVVVNAAANLCVHKKTLIMYSGFDNRTREYVVTYEVQMLLNSNRHGKACTFMIKPELNSQPEESAYVSIL